MAGLEHRTGRDTHTKRTIRAVVIGALILWTLLATMGCLPLPGFQSEPTRSYPTPEPESTYTPPATWPATWTPTATRTPTSTPGPRPTFTPLPGTPPPWMPPSASQPSSPSRAGGDLRLEFWMTDIWCPDSASYTARFWLRASGGDGWYTYYRDIDKIVGPITGEASYEVRWRECGGAPGTFFAESGDGQRVAKKFWIDPPDCCVKLTPTP